MLDPCDSTIDSDLKSFVDFLERMISSDAIGAMTQQAILRRQNLISEFASTLPELQSDLASLIGDDWPSDDVPLHNVGIVFSEALLGLLKDAGLHREELEKYNDFLERMVTSPDDYVQDVAVTGILGQLLGEASAAMLAKERNIMGPVSRASLDEFAQSPLFKPSRKTQP